MTNAARWGVHSSFAGYVHDLFDSSLSWSAVEWLRSQTRLPLLVKGILTEEDARHAVHAGVDGIIVSNHGGRQLDGVTPTIRALPEVVEAVAGRADVLMDGGIRRGTDVMKALAFGARAVLIGRAYLWGLAAAGEEGVRGVLNLLRDELQLAMALAGRPTIPSIDRSVISRPQVHGRTAAGDPSDGYAGTARRTAGVGCGGLAGAPSLHVSKRPAHGGAGGHRPRHRDRQRRMADRPDRHPQVRVGAPLDHHRFGVSAGHPQPGDGTLHAVYR